MMNEFRMRARTPASITISAVGLLFGLASGLAGAQRQATPEIRTLPVIDGIYLLMGGGGNVAVCSGEDGLFVIDDKLKPASDPLRAAISKISKERIRFVLNTHWHEDHTGGNPVLASEGAILVAHENVRTRMSTEQFDVAFNHTTPASPAQALPIVTFSRDIVFHLNGFEIEAVHVDPAHTDGDAIVSFKNANVVHMGDTYFNGLYPYIDTGSGGTPAGMIAAAERVLATSNDDTKIIPGHGPLSNRGELEAFRDMLTTVVARVEEQVRAGKSVEEVVASKPTQDFDAKWGGGFLSPDVFTRNVYAGVASK